MENADNVYIELQKHLDKQAVGFPATRSGVEIRILKELFSPEQAGLALHLNYRPQSTEDVAVSAGGSSLSPETVKKLLEEMADNGAIGAFEKNGKKYYYTMPLLVGIVELHSGKATPQFQKDFSEYMAGEFGKAYASTKVSQMRTVPVEKSIPLEYHVTTYDRIRDLINHTDGPISVAGCVCREGATKRGQPCHATHRAETCMSFGDWALHSIQSGHGREITRTEALEITRQNEADGLVLQPTNYQKFDFICACCGCCCGILKMHKMMPKPAENWAHNFYAAVNVEDCTACGMCVEKCQVNAARLDEQKGCSTINLDRCIGCGNCVAACPSKALKLVKKEKETTPPEDRVELYKILAERK
jgi:Na+-translocating ferredoxin:NAD+ oxidoreductase subunit B